MNVKMQPTTFEAGGDDWGMRVSKYDQTHGWHWSAWLKLPGDEAIEWSGVAPGAEEAQAAADAAYARLRQAADLWRRT